METILEKNKHIKRYATKEEISKCIESLAECFWQEAMGEDDGFVNTIALEQGEVEFKKEVLLDYQDIIGDFGIVDYFPEEDCSIITTSYARLTPKESCVSSRPFRFINEQGVYSFVKEEDTDFFNFKLSIFIKKTISSLENTVGIPNRPTNKSIEKTIEIFFDIMENYGEGIDLFCKLEGLHKSTYYKTLKWLEKNSIPILNKKD